MKPLKTKSPLIWFAASVLVVFGCLNADPAMAYEVTLFDSRGDPVAYIDTADEFTIYLWEGDPVAYLDGDSIYGFNGKHLGWYKEEIVWDHDGYRVGFTDGAIVDVIPNFEPVKGFKDLKPIESIEEFEPYEPLILHDAFSSISLRTFLVRGRK